MIDEHSIKHIRSFLIHQGFSNEELIDDLTDHLATEIEFCMDSEKLDFETSFEKAKQKLLPNSPYQLERDLKILTTPKHNIMMKKIAYIGGYVSIACLVLSVLFYFLSSINSKKASLMVGAAQQEFRQTLNGQNYDHAAFIESEFYHRSQEFQSKMLITNYDRFLWSERLFILAFLLFITTYLPYQFYHRYQKSQMELTA